jgi:hypothetical protein
VPRYALVLLGLDDSILLRDLTWITFARLLSWHHRVRPVDVYLFRSRRAALAVRHSWRVPHVVVVPVEIRKR